MELSILGFHIFHKYYFGIFINIYQKNCKKKTYFAELNKEFNNYKKYYYDFVISNIKICIEYNSEQFHPNPNMTKEKWNNWKQLYSTNTANEKYDYDQKKLNILRKRGFKVLEVWDLEYKKDQDKVLQECLNFIEERN